MGLDWNPGPKPRPGSEEEYSSLFHAILELERPQAIMLMKRFHEISVQAFETLHTPMVGRDDEADLWARQLYRAREREQGLEEFIEGLVGFYVLPLVPPCDGISRYTNGCPAGYVETYAFRGELLVDCAEIIGEGLLKEAYQHKLSAGLLDYGQRLLGAAEGYAATHGVALDAIEAPQEDGSVGFKLDVVRAAARWCVFWAERGHFLEPYY